MNNELSLLPGGAVSVSMGLPGEYLSFRLGGEEYGMPILGVQEIRGYGEATRIAGAPSYIKGVLNLRGVIVPIIDLRLKLGLSEVRYDSLTVTIVLNVGARVIGVVVDSVSDVLGLTTADIKPAPLFNAAVSADHITGIATLGVAEQDDRMLILLDIARLLSAADMGLVAGTLQ